MTPADVFYDFHHISITLVRMYGWFAGLICVGSCVGVVNGLALLLSRTSFSQGIDALPGLSIQQPNATISSFSDEMANAARWHKVANMP